MTLFLSSSFFTFSLWHCIIKRRKNDLFSIALERAQEENQNVRLNRINDKVDSSVVQTV